MVRNDKTGIKERKSYGEMGESKIPAGITAG